MSRWEKASTGILIQRRSLAKPLIAHLSRSSIDSSQTERVQLRKIDSHLPPLPAADCRRSAAGNA